MKALQCSWWVPQFRASAPLLPFRCSVRHRERACQPPTVVLITPFPWTLSCPRVLGALLLGVHVCSCYLPLVGCALSPGLFLILASVLSDVVAAPPPSYCFGVLGTSVPSFCVISCVPLGVRW